MIRAILTFTILIALSQRATAGVPLLGHVSCAVVRFYVAKYSEATAERWARSQGASNAEIETARRCLHSTIVQTASSAAKSEVLAPATEKRPEHERAERDPNQDALHATSAQGQGANPEQEKHEPVARDVIHAKFTEDISASNVPHEIKDIPASAAKKPTALRRSVSATYHHADKAGVTNPVSWFKRLWDHLTKRRQFSVAFLHVKGRR